MEILLSAFWQYIITAKSKPTLVYALHICFQQTAVMCHSLLPAALREAQRAGI